MFEFVFIAVLTILCYRKIGKYLTYMKADNYNGLKRYGDTVTVKKFAELDETNEVEENIEKLKELKETIKKTIKFELEREDIQAVLNLLSYLKEITEKINELEKADQSQFLAIKAKTISKRIINKLENYI